MILIDSNFAIITYLFSVLGSNFTITICANSANSECNLFQINKILNKKHLL